MYYFDKKVLFLRLLFDTDPISRAAEVIGECSKLSVILVFVGYGCTSLA